MELFFFRVQGTRFNVMKKFLVSKNFLEEKLAEDAMFALLETLLYSIPYYLILTQLLRKEIENERKKSVKKVFD